MMRSLTLLLGFCLLAAASTAGPLALRIDASMYGEAFAYETTYSEPGDGYDYRLTDLRYYISEIAITHDGGQQTELTGVYILVDLANQDQIYPLGDREISNVESIRMSIGVDQENNHKDPTLWPPTHPLAPQIPTMHWGWAAGYRFCTLEGYAGPKGFQPATKFEVHSVGNELYKTITIETGATDEDGTLTIQLLADYGILMTDIEANWGPIDHGSTGTSITLMENFTKGVFTAGTVTSVRYGEAATFTVAPNPARGRLTVSLENPGQATARLMDVSGTECARFVIEGGFATFDTSMLPSGAYTLVVEDLGGVVSSRMVSVTH